MLGGYHHSIDLLPKRQRSLFGQLHALVEPLGREHDTAWLLHAAEQPFRAVCDGKRRTRKLFFLARGVHQHNIVDDHEAGRERAVLQWERHRRFV